MSRSSKRKQQQANTRQSVGGFAATAHWQVYEVLLSQNWNQEAALVTILVARRSPKEKLAAAGFLVDLGCLGVKDAVVRLYPSVSAYHQDMRQHYLSIQPMSPADLNLAAKIIVSGVRYAEQLGFHPHSVYLQAQHLLADADPEACPAAIPLGGPEGKPLFVAGPYDNARQIVNHLTRHVGAGNFHYLVTLGSEEERWNTPEE